MAEPRAFAADVRRFFGLVARPGDVFELRGLARYNGQQQVSTGFFDDVELLARAALERSGQDDGVYVTINPVNPALLARAPKNKVRRAGSGDTTSDRDVAQRRIILVDVDPVRPTGISSTHDEHINALLLGWEIAADLCAVGWPEPIFASSGNGAHLIYAVELPVDDGGLVMRVLKQLSKRYSTPQLKVDEKVFNPARISKIYGTLTRKGEDTEDRPHRVARIIEAPDQLAIISRETLEAFAPPDAPRLAADPRANRQPATYTAERSTFNADDFIAQHLSDAKERTWASGRKWILPVCPFNDSHDRGEAHVEQLHSGAMSAGCLHESCKWTWKDLRKKFEPDAYAWEERRANGSAPPNGQHRQTDREPPPEVLYEDVAYQAELDAFADRDRDPAPAKEEPPPLLITIEEAINELAPLAKMPIYPTPFPTLNEAIGFGGLLGTQVYTVAAGTGRGKTSWVAAVAAHAAQTVPVIVATYEMKPGYFVARKAAGVLGVHSNAILRGEVTTAAVMRAMPYPNFFLMRKPTLKALRRGVEFLTKKYGTPPLVIVDYLQKLADEIASKQARPDLRMATAEASSVLLDIGDTTGAAIIAVSSIGRGKMRAHDKLRKMEPYELVEVAKESGSVEYDGAAMIVLSLSNEFEEENGELLRIGTMTLAKARFGTEMHIDSRYNGRRGSWWDRGRVNTVPGFETPPAPVAAEEEGREVEVRKLIVAELQRSPARNKTELLNRLRGARKETAKEVYEAMWIRGEIAKVGLGVALTETGRQLAIEEVK